jgi:hypothetical protein
MFIDQLDAHRCQARIAGHMGEWERLDLPGTCSTTYAIEVPSVNIVRRFVKEV